MKEHEALRALGLSAGAGETAIREAYARCVKAAHPDTGGTHSDMVTALKRLKVARDLLLSLQGGEIHACKTCQGVGIVRNIRCPSCGGRGTKG